MLRALSEPGVYRQTAWRVLGRMDPEDAHTLVLRALGVLQRTPGGLALLERLFAVRDVRLAVEAFGRRFPNPVGLAAGLDKEARAPHAFAALGFGSVEVGTVTPRAQPGNPRPRIFRLPEHRALVNRMGFPNGGASAARARLLSSGTALPGGAVLGVNLGKNAATPIEEAARDYVSVLETLHDLAGFAVVNVSSPNTKGLRTLQERRALEELLGSVVRRRDALAASAGRRLPVLVKVAPDLEEPQIAEVVEAALSAPVDGIVATNTTLSRDGVGGLHASEAGGLSGAPLRQRSTAVVRRLAQETGGRLPIVGAGGISAPEHAREKLDAGATLVQVYTGLIYEGPGLAGRICLGLMRRT